MTARGNGRVPGSMNEVEESEARRKFSVIIMKRTEEVQTGADAVSVDRVHEAGRGARQGLERTQEEVTTQGFES